MTTVEVKLIADVSILTKKSTVLLKYREYPDQQRGWFIPNIQIVESSGIADAVRGCVKSQIGLDVVEPAIFEVESFIGRDGSWHLALHYKCFLASEVPLAPGEGVSEAEWFSLDKLPPPDNTAHHGWYLGVINRAAKSSG